MTMSYSAAGALEISRLAAAASSNFFIIPPMGRHVALCGPKSNGGILVECSEQARRNLQRTNNPEWKNAATVSMTGGERCDVAFRPVGMSHRSPDYGIAGVLAG
jgi:hypothetical protein